MEIMDKRYESKKFEEKIYKKWEKSGGFEAKIDREKKPFTILMPPPNANDPLHVGHAMFVTVEDILIRFKRMQGYNCLWLPGADHAGIETQFVFEKKLNKKGKSRFDFKREKLYQMIWDYVQENKNTAINQIKRLGASADWSRFVFTLDEKIIKTVKKTFKKLHDDDLVYRDLKLVNYCTKCGTAFSNLEVKHKEKTTPFYYLRYGPFVLATTRPETKFGDTAVAVHPEDKRYKKYIGKKIEVEGLIGKFKIKVIADKAVDPKFGTGVVKITPAHDFNDFEIGKRHNLEVKQVIGLDGRLNELTGPYKGLTVNQAREKVVEDLRKKDLIEKIDENYVHSVGTCYRCGRVIEPLPLPQFFIKMKPLAKKVLEALDQGKVKVIGAGHDKILRHWLKNIEDWNISRQIVWGIRMPIWYLVSARSKLKPLLETKYVISDKKPKKSPKGMEWVQETDTFDTWFSSGQWPIAALTASDFEYFYPTQVMETGYDILFFWVARMLMLGLYLTGEVPFKTVYLHGLVRDEKGQKMSKSKGNVIDPLEMVGKYGADALRMALVMGTTPGKDKAVGEKSIRGMRNLGNKIWNAARWYVKSMPEGGGKIKQEKNVKKDLEDHIRETTERLEKLKIGQTAEWVYHWFWHTFCDGYIEVSKKGFISKKLMTEVLKINLKLLHPFVPFVTEAVWEEMEFPGLLMMEKWPTYAEASAEEVSEEVSDPGSTRTKVIKILVWLALGIGLGAGIKLARNLQIRQEIEAQVKERQKIVQKIQALEILDQEKPDWRDLKLKTALLYWQLGEEEEAIKWLKEAKLLDPNGEKVIEVEKIIKS